MTSPKLTGGLMVTGSCLLLLLAGGGACDRSGSNKAPKETPPSAATTPPPPATPPPPNPDDIPAPPDVKAPPADAEKTPSGLASKVLKPGTGKDKPSAADNVEVHYTGWTTDGRMFDSSVKRGAPARFPLGNVIKGWTEGLQLMTVGEKRRFWIPGPLAYGDNAMGGRPAGMLVFDVELLGFTPAPKPPAVPEDVAAAPKSAKKTKSGIAYKVLKKGTGKEHPKADSNVEVHYSGWTTDGKMFDSSVMRGQPATFPLNGVIPGWTEGVQLMTVGEKTRFWIPGNLAYDNSPRPGAPKGTLVFDIELLSIK
jgi:FKBP-type peptidyl-prolyl cis-trans isomerase